MSNKCEKCGVTFEGKTCPNCGEEIKEESPFIQSVKENQTPEYHPIEKPKPFWKNKSFIIPTIISLVLFAIVISLNGKINDIEGKSQLYKQDKDKFAKKFSTISDQYDTLKAEYKEYKEKMKPYEELDAAEAEARKIEADRIAAEKKAADEKAAAEKKAAEDKAAAEKKAAEEKAAAATNEQKNALSQANSYLGIMAFSYTGLIEQLKFEGYSDEAATYAADSCGADWNEQAAKKAKEYLNTMSFSHSGLVDQLTFEGFTAEQAEYGVSAAGL